MLSHRHAADTPRYKNIKNTRDILNERAKPKSYSDILDRRGPGVTESDYGKYEYIKFKRRVNL